MNRLKNCNLNNTLGSRRNCLPLPMPFGTEVSCSRAESRTQQWESVDFRTGTCSQAG
jgi:hypothetical protein